MIFKNIFIILCYDKIFAWYKKLMRIYVVSKRNTDILCRQQKPTKTDFIKTIINQELSIKYTMLNVQIL